MMSKTIGEDNIQSIKTYVTELKRTRVKVQYQKQLLVCQAFEVEEANDGGGGGASDDMDFVEEMEYPIMPRHLVLCQVTVSNSNPTIVMVGFRVPVGNTLANHIPSEITIFQRVIKLDEGMRSWYDIPFIVAESLLADEEITISIGTTFNRSTLPRIDTLEIYGRVKDEFGWKEKMDAVLDMEARVLGSSSWVSGSGKKRCIGQVTPIEEQFPCSLLYLMHLLFAGLACAYSKAVAFKLVADTPLLTGQQTIFLFFPDMIKGMFLAVVIGPTCCGCHHFNSTGNLLNNNILLKQVSNQD
ncbi:unnamed protein product [Lactuca saligna]|uniref:Uncharacterized protein n=1 Tax=Lactuca saligna TaxID=75948 RepID=A0AA35YNI4_LACSI|nr:unnamed protein product [Lactuca saligna]